MRGAITGCLFVCSPTPPRFLGRSLPRFEVLDPICMKLGGRVQDDPESVLKGLIY